MIVSVYSYTKKMFDYYEVPGAYDRSTRYRALTQKPQGSPQMGGVGYAPEALGVPLPPGARQVGTGKEARGIVAFDPRPVSARTPVAMSPSSPSTWEESVAGFGGPGLHGVGATDVVEVQTRSTPFVQVVAASSIAAVVGVIVTRALSKKKRGR